MILITGATGWTGQELARILKASGAPTRALVRDERRARGIDALDGVAMVTGDLLRPKTLASALEGIDRAMLISASTPDMALAQCNFVDAAARPACSTS